MHGSSEVLYGKIFGWSGVFCQPPQGVYRVFYVVSFVDIRRKCMDQIEELQKSLVALDEDQIYLEQVILKPRVTR